MKVHESKSSLRRKLGVIIVDMPRLICSLCRPSGWVRMRNRHESVTFHPCGGGKCEWLYSRSLYLCEVFPATAKLLLGQALREWPIRLGSGRSVCTTSINDSCGNQSEAPRLSFIIGHRGMDRVPHLLATLRSIAQQVNVRFECVVVEQDANPLLQRRLPDWVRYLHAPLPGGEETRYNRSAAYNAGSRIARGKVLILHDNDLLAPFDYAAEVWRHFEAGYEIIQLKRFIFYLNEKSTNSMFASNMFPRQPAVERVIENMQGGTSLAISTDAYESIGGMDEAFVGWGGEDNELWDRCLTRKVWGYAYLPFVHLWHPSLADRHISNPMLALLAEKLKIPAEDRINTLCALRENQVSRADQEGMAPCC